MPRRRSLSFAALSAGGIAGVLALQNPVAADPSVDCWMNSSQQACMTRPWGQGGFEMTFSRGAIDRLRAGRSSHHRQAADAR